MSFFPRRSIPADADNNVQSVVAEVEALAVALRSVPDECKGVVLEVFLQAPVRVTKLMEDASLTRSLSLGQSSRSMQYQYRSELGISSTFEP